MKPDPLDRLSKIYHEALARAESERGAFLADACAGDEALRHEVEALLRYDAAAAPFMETPALAAVATQDVPAPADPSAMTGRQIGAYTIVSFAGAGGMGDVYRARDSRLGRDVAIKFLPPVFAADPARRSRFEREARLLATLNHPNIAQVHGLEESEGTQALVMEWVPGETLAEQIETRTIPDGLVLSIARQIADAVDAAHESGILHRDLKPANIKIRPDGVVKVLDFGLAKAFAVDSMAAAPGGSATEHARTQEGALIGTAPYMSPEQARGMNVDKRTDVWAFGCILYELWTGRPPFAEPTVTDTLAAILQREPDWDRLPPTMSPRLRELVRRCLAKDPRRRLRDIGDARLELEFPEPAGRLTAPPSVSRMRERIWIAVAALATVVAAVLAGSKYLAPTPSPDLVSFTVTPPEEHAFPPISVNAQGFAISPDGRHLAFVATRNALSQRQLWVRALDSPLPRPLSGTEGASAPVWSPDSETLIFSSGNSLKRVSRTGGAPLTLTDFSGSAAAWSRDGVILLTGPDGGLYRIPDRGGEPVLVADIDRTRQENRLIRPVFLPDGRRFIFQAATQDVSKSALFLGSLDSPSRTHLLDGQTNAAYADGYLVYQRRGGLVAHRFDETSGHLVGEAVPAIENIATDSGRFAAFSIARNGTLVYRTNGGSGRASLAWFDRRGRRVEDLGESGSSFENPRLSPDGRRLAMSRKDRDQQDIWVMDLERKVPSPLTTDPAMDDYPIWSPDGTRIIFASNRKGPDDLYWRPTDGSGTDELLFASAQRKRPTSVSPDGTLLFTVRTGPGDNSLDIWALRLGTRQPYPVMTSADANEFNGVFSPDGRWIAYQRGGNAGRPEIYLQPFPATGSRVRLSTAVGGFPQWSPDGRQVFYCTGDSLAAVDVSAPAHPGVPQPLFAWPWFNLWTVDSSGQRFLRPVATDGDAESLTVVLNWTSGLRRK